MTVTTIGAPEQYVANGVTTIFDYHSRVLLTTDVAVFVNNVQQFSGYTVTLLGGGNSGARVTFSIAPANGLVVELSNEPPPTQLIDYTENTPFPANVQEFGLDKLTLLMQGVLNIVNRVLRRALRVPIFEAGINELPSVATRAGKFLMFDANGQPTVASIVVGTSGISLTASSIAALKAINVALVPNNTMCAVASYYGIGGSASQFGGGVFRYNSASVAADNRGTIVAPNVGSGRWERMYDGELWDAWFGTVGDGVTDDTLAWQTAFDASISLGQTLHGRKGNFLVGPLYLNGSSWVAGGKVIVPGVELAAVRSFIGQGRMGFGTRFIAKPGAYGASDAVISGFQLVNRRYEGITVDCALVANRGIYTEWSGPDAANGNTFQHWFVENCVNGQGPAIEVSGAADGLISNFTVRGGTPAVGLRCLLSGGAFWMDNVYIYTGVTQISCQNCGIVNFAFFKGLKIVAPSDNCISLHAGQMSQDPADGLTITTKDIGSGNPIITSMVITSTLFLKGSSFVAHFGGRWYSGANLNGCAFLDDGYFDAGITSINGVANFNFDYCKVDGGGAVPVGIPGTVNVSLWQFRNSSAVVSSNRTYAGNVLVGDGTIEANAFEGKHSGMFLLDGTGGAIRSDAFAGFCYDRSVGLGETEIVFRDGASTDPLLRFTAWDGTTASILLTMNAASGQGFYPTPTNTWKLGRLGNLWTEVFATNPVINVSDADLKTSLTALSGKELAAGNAMLDNIITFQWNDAIEAKGGKDKARLHVGLIAQDVKAVFAKNGMSADRYGIYCYDEWDADADREAGKQHALRTTEAMLLMLASLNERVKKLEN